MNENDVERAWEVQWWKLKVEKEINQHDAYDESLKVDKSFTVKFNVKFTTLEKRINWRIDTSRELYCEFS